MPSRKWKLLFLRVLVLVPVLILGLWWGADAWMHSNPVRQKVWELIDPKGVASSMYRHQTPSFRILNGVIVQGGGNPKTAGPPVDPFRTIQDYISEHGAEVYTYLNEFALYRESSWHGFYRKNFPRMPSWLQSKLPAPMPPEQISLHAYELIERLGPAAARACAEAVLEGVDHSSPSAKYLASQSFWYVLPGSQSANNKLLLEMEEGNQELFRIGIDRSILRWQWSQDFPQKMQITNGLAHVALADEIFFVLDHMGDEAVPAIPIVMDRMHQLDQLGDQDPTIQADHKERFRRKAMEFLVKFGNDRAEVNDFILRYVNDADPLVRAKAGEVLAKSAARSPDLIPTLLQSLLDADLNAWVIKMTAIGHMGGVARQILPDVLPFTSEDYIKSWYEDLKTPYKKTLSFTHLLNIKLAACVAVGRIDPERVVEHLPFLVEAIGLHGDPVLFLKEATMLSDEIVPLVEPYLQSPVDKKQVIAADILLNHLPDHSDALSTLELQLELGTGSANSWVAELLLKHDAPRLLANETLLSKMKGGDISAAHIYSKVSQDFQYLLPLIEKGLRSDQLEEVNASLNVLLEMEDKPKHFIPIVQETLNSERMVNRSNAFTLLLDYGIEHLPPVRE